VGALKYRAVKGTRDLLPPEAERFAAAEGIAREVFSSYGYGEVRTPVLEATELFARSVGETTDIVHKEMYTFADRKGRSLTMRPENTAGVVRALVEKGLQDMPRPIRLWYCGEQFRYEQPQKGRFREFRQIGAELLGVSGPEADAELLAMLFDFLRRLNFADLSVTLNSVPSPDGRQKFAEAVRAHVRPQAERLGTDDRRRLEENPLRLFDSKDPVTRGMLEGAPKSREFLDDASQAHYERLKQLLSVMKIPFTEDATLVRGLDYYTVTVFEVVSRDLGAQDAILGGGRYDNLVADLGGPDMPAIGFAIGEDRLLDVVPADPRPLREVFFVVPFSKEQVSYALKVAGRIRRHSPEAVVDTDLTGRGFKKGFARAAQVLEDSAGSYAFRASEVRVVSLGPEEEALGTMKIKTLSTRAEESRDLSWLPPESDG
jgi:histidyl-tRNA synthetase